MMKPRILAVAAATMLLAAGPAQADAGLPQQSMAVWILILISLIILFVIWRVVAALSAAGSTWTLAMALSENEVLKDAAGNPVTDPVTGQPKSLVSASSSRLIAFMGMVVIVCMFLGIGYYIIWGLFTGIDVAAKLTGIWAYFAAGSSLFAPYAANQLAELLKK